MENQLVEALTKLEEAKIRLIKAIWKIEYKQELLKEKLKKYGHNNETEIDRMVQKIAEMGKSN